MVELTTVNSGVMVINGFKDVYQLVGMGTTFITNDTYTLVRGEDEEAVFISPDGDVLRVLLPALFDAIEITLRYGFTSDLDLEVMETLLPYDMRTIHYGKESRYDQTGLSIY